jgi:hypothetical protein
MDCNPSPDQIKDLLLRKGKRQSAVPLHVLDTWAILQALDSGGEP